MKNLLLAAAAACSLLAPRVTPAQLVLGGQVGVGPAFGDVEEAAPLEDFANVAIPLELRAGWRLTPEIVVGLQGGYVVAFEGEAWDDACSDAGQDCTAHLWRVAARGEYAFGDGRWRPFVAAALGWEWLVTREELGSDNWEQATYGGPTLGLDAGVDLAVSRHFTLGAYAGVSAGVYLSKWVEGEIAGYAYDDSAEVGSKGVHTWLTAIGLRGTFQLW